MNTNFLALLITFIFGFCSASSFSQTSIEWGFGEDVVISGDSTYKAGISRVAISYVRSVNLLYGKNEYGYKNGGFQFVSKTTTDRSKIIGFDVINEGMPSINEIEYGFSFDQNHFSVFTRDTIIDDTFSANDTFEIVRIEDSIFFRKNGNDLFSLLVDPYEEMVIEAQHISPGSKFNSLSTTIISKLLNLIPIIHNLDDSIKLTLPENSTIKWEDGETKSDLKKYLDGNYLASIRDGLGNTTKKMYSVGKDVLWDSFYASQVVDTNILSYYYSGMTPPIYGGAISTVTLNPNDQYWLEYVSKVQSGTKGIGLIRSSITNVTSYAQFSMGFLFSGNRVQVIHDGSVMSTFNFFEEDVFLIRVDEDSTHKWNLYLNGNRIATYVINLSNTYNIGGLLTNGSTIEELHYSGETYSTLMDTEWDDLTHLGTVELDLSTIATITDTNFHYFLSPTLLPPLEDTYNQLNTFVFDSILDKNQFLSGTNSHDQWISSTSTPGSYYLSAFDNHGEIILQKKIQLRPPLKFDTLQNITQIGNKLVSTSSDSWGILSHESIGNKEIHIQIDGIIKNSGLFLGFCKFGPNFDSLSDIDEGITIENSSMSAVINGVVQPKRYLLNENSFLTIKRNGDKIQFYLNNDILVIDNVVSAALDKQFAVNISGIGGLIVVNFPGVVYNWKSFYKFTATPSNCFSGIGQISVDLQPYPPTYQLTHHILSVKLYDDNQDEITAASSVPEVSALFNGLLPGTYELVFETSYSDNITSLMGLPVFTTVFVTVASRMIWTDLDDAIYQISDESIVATQSQQLTDLSSAVSKNMVASNYPYYIDFQLKTLINPPWFALNMINWSDVPQTTLGSAMGIAFVTGNSSLAIINLANSANIGTYPLTEKFRFVVASNGTGSLHRINSLGGIEPIATGIVLTNPERIITYFSWINTGFKNVSTNLPCAERNIYAKLARKISGEKYRVYLDQILFYFDQEYESQSADLTYKVFENLNPVTPVMSSVASPESVIYGDNRYSLDVGSLTTGEYILEVTNDKLEKFYLRFQIIN